jgi:hypothetical protein
MFIAKDYLHKHANITTTYKNIKTEIIYKKIISCKTWVEITESFNLKGVERKSKKREHKGAD